MISESVFLSCEGFSQCELRLQIQYLKVENEFLRARERYRLIRLAKPLGAAVHDHVTIVKPDTLMRWTKAPDKKHEYKQSTRRCGCNSMPEDIRHLVLRIARETSRAP